MLPVTLSRLVHLYQTLRGLKSLAHRKLRLKPHPRCANFVPETTRRQHNTSTFLRHTPKPFCPGVSSATCPFYSPCFCQSALALALHANFCLCANFSLRLRIRLSNLYSTHSILSALTSILRLSTFIYFIWLWDSNAPDRRNNVYLSALTLKPPGHTRGTPHDKQDGDWHWTRISLNVGLC